MRFVRGTVESSRAGTALPLVGREARPLSTAGADCQWEKERQWEEELAGLMGQSSGDQKEEAKTEVSANNMVQASKAVASL